MALQLNSKPVALVLSQMEASPIKFYLTGSRFWGTNKPLSDWDFFAESTPELTKWLESHGFVPSHAYDTIMFCHRVWEYEQDDLIVQVQAVTNVDDKVAVQDVLYKNYPSGFRSKEHAREMWSIALITYVRSRSDYMSHDRIGKF